MPVENNLPENLEASTATAVCGHLMEMHHQPCREMFPDIAVHLLAAEKVDGQINPGVRKIRFIFERFQELSGQHMRKAEFVFYPFVMRLENRLSEGKSGSQEAEATLLRRPIELMQQEHAEHERLAEQLDALIMDLKANEEHASPTLHLLLRELKQLTANYRRHILIEEKILFPKALALEGQIQSDKLPPTNSVVL